MSRFILLTAGQADHVRGPSPSTPSASLDPVERAGGVFILGAGVLSDPAHAEHREYLKALPQAAPEDLPPPAPEDLPEDVS